MASRIVKLRNIKQALKIEPNEAISYILSGRVSNFRPYRSFNFIDLIDGSSKDHLQVVISRDLLKKPELGAYITCQGNLVPSRGPKQPIEFKVKELKFLGECDPLQYPLAISQSSGSPSNNWYRQYTHLRPRAEHFSSLLRVKSELELSLHMIMKQMDFFRVHTPSLTSNDSEASSDLFTVKRTKADSQLMTEKHELNGRESNQGDEEELEEDDSEYEKGEKEEEIVGREEEEEEKLKLEKKNAIENRDKDSIDCLDYVNDDDDRINDRTSDCSTQRDNKRNNEDDSKRMRTQRIIRDGYFNKDVFLITSAQLHLENLAVALSRVYTLSTAFRAESSISTRHLCEFLMFELEEANVNDLEPLMNRAESIIKFVAQFLGEISEHKSDFNFLLERNSNSDNYTKLSQSPYIRMSYLEALEVLRDKTDFSGDTSYGCDIGRLHEKKLLDYCNNVPIFITNYPKQLKPFYMKCDPNDKEALCFDLIAPHGGELCGGSLREDSLDKLLANLKKIHQQQQQATKSTSSNGNSSGYNTNEDDNSLRHFEWYLDSRRFGTFPHGGFGIGIERLIQSLLGIKNIKDTTAFPRWVRHCPM